MYRVVRRTGDIFGDEPHVCEFVCDTSDDVATLPTSIAEGTGGKSKYDNQKCSAGSTACIATNSGSNSYILNNSNVWIAQSSGSGSGSGGSSEGPVSTDIKFPVVTELPSNPEVGKPYIYSDERHGEVIALYAYAFWQFIPMYHMTKLHNFLASELMAYTTENGMAGCVSLIDRVMTIGDKSFSKAIQVSGMSNHGNTHYAVITLNVGNATSANVYLEKCSEAQDNLVLIVNGTEVSTDINSAGPVSDTLGVTTAATINLVSGINTIKVGISKDGSIDKGLDSVFLYGIDMVTDLVEGVGGGS